ncbi:MAG: ankyrin repeat domain-containing protein [Halobacteriovoraceae bacterium]|nr:ankyrin repeat domain-containing protein [Halobacteriovoraceae bacterium]
MKIIYLFFLFAGMQNLSADSSRYCEYSWWKTAIPSDFDRPLQDPNMICNHKAKIRIIHVALATRGLNPVSFFNFLTTNSSKLNLEIKNSGNNAPLHYAVSFQHDPTFAAFLISAGVDIETTDGFYQTPLHRAAAANTNPKMVQLLLEQKADIHAKNIYGETPFHNAVKYNPNPEVIKLLMNHGADTDEPTFPKSALPMNDPASTFIEACVHRSITAPIPGSYPIHLAARWNPNPDIIALLIENGADVNQGTLCKNYTPLHHAILNPNPIKVLELLFDNQAQPNIYSSSGLNPLQTANLYKKSEVAEFLLENGAEDLPLPIMRLR